MIVIDQEWQVKACSNGRKQTFRIIECKKNSTQPTRISQLFDIKLIDRYSGHNRGSTVDLTIIKLPPAIQEEFQVSTKLKSCIEIKENRFLDNSIDMGTGYDCMDEKANIYDADINSQAFKNRMKLREIMMKNGFVPYAKEWWHFTLANEPYPQTYFDFMVD